MEVLKDLIRILASLLAVAGILFVSAVIGAMMCNKKNDADGKLD